MPKKAQELSAIQVRRLLKKSATTAVGGVRGLYLRVRGPGAAYWLLRVQSLTSPEGVYGLGSYPEVDLATARDKARLIRRQIELGQDPNAEKRAAKAALAVAVVQELAASVTFEEASIACHAKKAQEFKNDKHAAQWISTLRTYAFPKIGSVPVRDCDRTHVLQVVQPIWTTKAETASRVRQRMHSVFAWAKASGYRSGENPAEWDDALDQLLPSTSKIRKKRHHPALPWQEVPEFMARLRRWPSIAALPLEFLILTAARSQEVRFATPKDVDKKAGVWTVPAEYMKAGLLHRVPLVGRALEIAENAPRRQGNPHLFPGENSEGALSENTLADTLQQMKVAAVPHGFRSSFKDWCRVTLGAKYADEVSELALAHVSTDATRAAYARDELLEPRRNLMTEWAAYCCGSK